jgi:hypothetical protein
MLLSPYIPRETSFLVVRIRDHQPSTNHPSANAIASFNVLFPLFEAGGSIPMPPSVALFARDCVPGRTGTADELNLNSFDLAGRASAFLGNLSFLRQLNLGNNGLGGQVP